MKKTSLLLILLLPFLLIGQKLGNAISRQNISVKMGNSGYYNQRISNEYNELNPNETIVIDLKALYNVKADSYTAVFNLTQIGNTAEETSQLMQKRIESVKSEMKTYGILDKDIDIDIISFVPVYETEVVKKLFSKKYNEVPKGFELQQNLHVKFYDSKSFEKILTSCANNEVYNLVKVDYYIKDLHLIYKKLQEELIKLVTDKKGYYTALGIDLSQYKPMLADNKYCYFPKSFYNSYEAYNSISFEAIKKSRNVTTAKKLTSFYYQPLTYENYDLVINEAILEPVVQVGMDLKIQYVPKKVKKEQKTTTKYYMVSPNGNIDIKELEINN